MSTKKSSKKTTVQNPVRRTNLVVKLGAVVIAIVLILIFLLPNLKEDPVTGDDYMFKKEGELTFADSAGSTKIKIDIEVADTEYDRQLGLMNRKEMNEKQGMLFIFPREEFQSFWMRNTFISLDILFVSADYRIVTIHKRTQTLSDQSYPSSKPAKYVIEVVGGFTDKFNINAGDKVNWMGVKL